MYHQQNLTVQVIRVNIACNFRLPLVAVVQQLFLIIQQFFVSLRGKFEIGALHNSVNRTGLLTEPAINAFCHVNIVSGGSARTVSSFFRLNRNSLETNYSLNFDAN